MSMNVLISYDCPINLEIVNNTLEAYGHCADGTTPSLSWRTTTLSPSNLGEIRLYFTPGSVSQVYVWFFNPTPAEMVLYSMALQYEGFAYLWLKTQAALGYLLFLIWLVYGFWEMLQFVKSRTRLLRRRGDDIVSMQELTKASSSSLSSPSENATSTTNSKVTPILIILATILHGLSYAGMSVIATLGCIYGPFREISIAISLGLVVFISVSDSVLYNYKYKKEIVAWYWRTLFIASSISWMLSSLIAIPLSLLGTTPAAVCGIFYALYLIGGCLRLALHTLLQYYYAS